MKEVKEVLVVKELDKIKALSNSYRIGIIEAFANNPATAKQISVRIGEPHGKVNYHIKLLAKVGILELVDVSTKLGVVEKFYAPVAKNYVIDSQVLKTDEFEYNKSAVEYRESIFDRLSKDFEKSISNANLTHSRKLMYMDDIYLTMDEALELDHTIQNVISEYANSRKHKKEYTEKYSVTSLLIPIDDK